MWDSYFNRDQELYFKLTQVQRMKIMCLIYQKTNPLITRVDLYRLWHGAISVGIIWQTELAAPIIVFP